MAKGKYASKQEVINGEGSIFYFNWAIYLSHHHHNTTRDAVNTLSSLPESLELVDPPRIIIETIEETRDDEIIKIASAPTKKRAVQIVALLDAAGFHADYVRELMIREDYDYKQVARLVNRVFEESKRMKHEWEL